MVASRLGGRGLGGNDADLATGAGFGLGQQILEVFALLRGPHGQTIGQTHPDGQKLEANAMEARRKPRGGVSRSEAEGERASMKDHEHLL
jgi:hypothetical protein